MAWTGSSPNQSVQRTDGTRTGATTWVQADAADVDIIATDHDTHDQDMADMINSCLKKDGGNTATGNVQMGGFRLTNLGAGAARTESFRVGDAQDNKATYYPTVGGTADAITLTGAAGTLTAYVTGQKVSFKATATNTTAVTVNIDSVGDKSVYGPTGTALSAGAIVSGTIVNATYDGTGFQVENTTSAVAIDVGFVAIWPEATVPTGWLECDGSAVSRTTYAALFTKLSTHYGVGDNSTTFNLPNYKDYFLRGFDAAGTDASSRTDRGDGTTGANVGTKQASDYLAHVHAAGTLAASAPTLNNGTSVITGTVNVNAGATGTGRDTIAVGTGVAVTITANAPTISGSTATAPTSGGTETRPKNITVKFIILALPSATLPAYGGGVTPVSGFTASARNVHTGSNPATAAADGTNLDVVVTELYVAEVFIPCNTTVTGVGVFMGSNTNGNIKVMLFDSAGTRVAISISTDASGFTADSYSRVAFIAAYSALGPATYYVGVIGDDNTNDLNTHVVGNFGAGKITGLVYGTESGYASITLPTTFTTGLGPIATLY